MASLPYKQLTLQAYLTSLPYKPTSRRWALTFSHLPYARVPRRHHLGESPPSHEVGWLMGATPPESNGMLGSSPGSFSSRGRCVAFAFAGLACAVAFPGQAPLDPWSYGGCVAFGEVKRGCVAEPCEHARMSLE
eukprot:1158947-Pelagomonas_calceolata.AAC.5